jgi:hypothetical protein
MRHIACVEHARDSKHLSPRKEERKVTAEARSDVEEASRR